MCIIYLRNEGIDLPYEKFKTSVTVNPDGFGLSIPDGDGRLFTLRELSDKPDPEDLYRLLHEEFCGEQAMIHLRYTTAGETSLRNCHPFPVLEYKTDGVDLRMSHNGTISKFFKRSSDLSDTRHFVKDYVRPLFKRLIKGHDIEDILSDPFVTTMLEDMIPATSVLTFMDGFGNHLIINEKGNGGEWKEGWYHSNSYSFDENHRTSNYGYGTYRSYTSYQPYRGGTTYTGPKAAVDNTKTSASSTGTTTTTTSTKANFAMDTKQEYFSEKYGVDLKDMGAWDDVTIGELIEEFPEDTALLLKELIAENIKLSDRLEETLSSKGYSNVG